jgi:hypothetical protein
MAASASSVRFSAGVQATTSPPTVTVEGAVSPANVEHDESWARNDSK